MTRRLKEASIWLVPVVMLTACGIDPRWGDRVPTNQSFPGSPGVDARWGGPRSGLQEPVEWQYQELSGDES